MTDKQGVDMPHRTCSISGCERPHARRGWCSAHFWRWQTHGDVLHGGPIRKLSPWGLTEAEAFAWHMRGDPPEKGCWDWTGNLATTGYGQFWTSGRPAFSHVASHRIYNGHDPLTDEKPCVLHSCDRRVCVQPAHLHAGSLTENIAEMVARGRQAVGARVGGAKLTDDDVLEIRQSDLPQRVLARKFGVSQGTIGFIVRGETWKHLL